MLHICICICYIYIYIFVKQSLFCPLIYLDIQNCKMHALGKPQKRSFLVSRVFLRLPLPISGAKAYFYGIEPAVKLVHQFLKMNTNHYIFAYLCLPAPQVNSAL